MGDLPKTARAGAVEKIFDRLTVLALTQELLLQGTYGPLTEKQKEVLESLMTASRDAARLLRELVDGGP